MLLWRERSLQFTEKTPTPVRQLPITGSAHKAGNGRRPLPAATGIARSARRPPRGDGSKTVRPSCCRFRTITSSSPCRPRSATIAFQNKAAVYDLLFRTAAETLTTIAADPKHLGARIGLTAVLHTWGSAMTHHPHVHVIVPGGGCRRTGRAGSPASAASFCRCGCCRACSAASSSKGSQPCMRPDASSSSATLPRSPIKPPSTPSSRHCAARNGLSTPRGRSPGRRPSSPTCRATPIASRSRTPGSSRSTRRASPSAGRIIAPAAAVGEPAPIQSG